MSNEVKKDSFQKSTTIVLIFLLVFGRYIAQNKRVEIIFKDLGVKMVRAGAIDKIKFENLYNQRGGLSEADERLLSNSHNGKLIITNKNSGVILNILWPLGLGNKNPILDSGPMMDKRYGETSNFASTGGWTLAQGSAMDHYSMHSFVTLTPEQQTLVEQVTKNIYRPCCDNSTYFPDCNHDMAMLGLLELMASQGVAEADMYKIALQVNTLWFPEQYKTIEIYAKNNKINLDPKKIISSKYSSASGYQKIFALIKPQEQKGSRSCGA